MLSSVISICAPGALDDHIVRLTERAKQELEGSWANVVRTVEPWGTQGAVIVCWRMRK